MFSHHLRRRSVFLRSSCHLSAQLYHQMNVYFPPSSPPTFLFVYICMSLCVCLCVYVWRIVRLVLHVIVCHHLLVFLFTSMYCMYNVPMLAMNMHIACLNCMHVYRSMHAPLTLHSSLDPFMYMCVCTTSFCMLSFHLAAITFMY